MHIVALVLGTLCVLAVPARGQVNIEKLRTASLGLSATGSVNAALRTGSVERREIGFEGRFDFMGSSNATLVLLQSELGWQDGRRYSNIALSHLRHTLDLRPTVALEFFTQIDYARQRRLDVRWLFGGGIRISLVPGLYYGSAYMWELEDNDLSASAQHPRHTRHHRWSQYVSLRHETEQEVVGVASVYYQARFDDLSDHRVLAEARIAAPLTTRVALVATFDLRRDSRPPDGVPDQDSRLGSRLAIDL
ncbi:MAG: hypothetical protein VX733_06835 [Candidatus Latescibacterota bacterium]|nr:hypothetical protein [Candidatus Latescibacterota bacterium]